MGLKAARSHYLPFSPLPCWGGIWFLTAWNSYPSCVSPTGKTELPPQSFSRKFWVEAWNDWFMCASWPITEMEWVIGWGWSTQHGIQWFPWGQGAWGCFQKVLNSTGQRQQLLSKGKNFHVDVHLTLARTLRISWWKLQELKYMIVFHFNAYELTLSVHYSAP